MFTKQSPPPFTVEPPRKGSDSRAIAAAAAMTQRMNDYPDYLEDVDDMPPVIYETVMHLQNEYGIATEVRTYEAIPRQKEQRRPSLVRHLAFLRSMTVRRKSSGEQHTLPQKLADDEYCSPPSSFGGRITAQVKKRLSAFPFPWTDATRTGEI